MFGALFWVRLSYAGVLVGLPLLAVGAPVWLATRRRRRNGLDTAGGLARAGRIAGLLLGALAGIVAVFAEQALIAIPLVALGFLLGILVAELRTTPQPTGPVRVASLQARLPWRNLPRWIVPASVGLGVVVIVAPAVFAVAPTVSGASWPPALLTVQLALTAAIALIAGATLLVRLAALPQRASAVGAVPDDRARESTARESTARAIAGAVLGIEMLAAGAMCVAGSSGLAGSATAGTGYMGAGVLVWFGLGLCLAGIVTWATLSWWRPGQAGEVSSRPSPAST